MTSGVDPARGPDLADARRRLWQESAGIAVSAAGFGFVYGLSARGAGFSPIEAVAMSVLVFAGAAQFAAVGYVAGGLAWPGVILLTALLNARHLLYSAALAPWLRDRPRSKRAVMAYVLTDEAFALSSAHFRRLGRADDRGYWIAAIASTWVPWNLATVAGVVLGAQLADPAALGLDIIFPAAMAGLCVGLITGRRELVAAAVGATVGVTASLAFGTAVGIIAGGLVGPLAGLLVPASRAAESAPLGSVASAERYAVPGSADEIDEAMAGLPEPPETPSELAPDALETARPPDEGAPR